MHRVRANIHICVSARADALSITICCQRHTYTFIRVNLLPLRLQYRIEVFSKRKWIFQIKVYFHLCVMSFFYDTATQDRCENPTNVSMNISSGIKRTNMLIHPHNFFFYCCCRFFAIHLRINFNSLSLQFFAVRSVFFFSSSFLSVLAISSFVPRTANPPPLDKRILFSLFLTEFFFFVFII